MNDFAPELRAMLGRVRQWTHEHANTEQAEQGAAQLEEFAQSFTDNARDFTDNARDCQEAAAWCRLLAAWLRREDVPLSIYPEEGEDPADTARWKEWRVS